MTRILVIDDSPSAVQRARTVLENAGYTVETLDLLIYLPHLVKEDPPDLILLDLSMPALSGVNVARFIRRYERHPIPIVLYSSRTTFELKEAVREMNAAGFVQKGEPDEQLLSTVVSAVRGTARTSR